MKSGDEPELHVQFGESKFQAKGQGAVKAVRPVLFYIITMRALAAVGGVTASAYGIPYLVKLVGY